MIIADGFGNAGFSIMYCERLLAAGSPPAKPFARHHRQLSTFPSVMPTVQPRDIYAYISAMTDAANTSHARNPAAAFGGGAIIGALGGLIGLGGAEFRLPILIGFFNFAALEAVILNKAMSLVVVATALPFRAGTVPFSAIADNWPIVLNLLAGSLIGAWFGAGWATKLRSETLYKVIAIMLVAIAIVLVFGHDATAGY
jgi:uncharacterized membrane protein YfcA